MRSRFTTVTLTGSATYSTANPKPYNTWTSTKHNFDESISSGSGVYGADRSCRHYKQTHNYAYTYSGITAYYDGGRVVDYGTIVNHAIAGGNFPAELSAMVSMPQFDLPHYAANAYAAMRPTMTSGFSLTNFLLELRDVRKLFKLWERHQSLIKNAANGHLNYSFGWAPLLRDLKSMFRGMAEFDLRFAGFLDRSGLQQKRYYSASVEPTSYDTPLTQAYWSAPHKLKHEVRCSLRRFGAKLTYNYELPPLSMNAMRTRALLDTLGLNLKPSQIWEAIPFSFVVDWFIKVGGFLQSIEEMDWLNPVLRVESMLYSLKEVGTDTCFIQPWYSNGNSIQVVASHTFSYYTRWFGPVYNSKVELDGDLHPGRVLLGASLFITSRK